MLNFVFIRGLVSSILVSGVQKPPKPSNLCQKIDFSGEQKVAAHEGGRRRNGTGRMRTWGQEGAATAFWDKFRGMGGFIGPMTKMKPTTPQIITKFSLFTKLFRLMEIGEYL